MFRMKAKSKLPKRSGGLDKKSKKERPPQTTIFRYQRGKETTFPLPLEIREMRNRKKSQRKPKTKKKSKFMIKQTTAKSKALAAAQGG